MLEKFQVLTEAKGRRGARKRKSTDQLGRMRGEKKNRLFLEADVFAYVHDITDDTDADQVVTILLLLAKTLGVEDELVERCAQRLNAAAATVPASVSAHDLLRLRYKLNESMTALRDILAEFKALIPAANIATMDEVRAYRDGLAVPECRKVQGVDSGTHRNAKGTARAMRAGDCLRAGLGSEPFVESLDWTGLGKAIHVCFGIDAANMTVSRSLELAFVGVLNQRLLRHAPAAAFISYIGEHPEKRHELQVAIEAVLGDLGSTVQVPCRAFGDSGKACKYPGCTKGSEEHECKIQCWHVCDLSATLKAMGCKSSCCFRCGQNLRKIPVDPVKAAEKAAKAAEKAAKAAEKAAKAAEKVDKTNRRSRGSVGGASTRAATGNVPFDSDEAAAAAPTVRSGKERAEQQQEPAADFGPRKLSMETYAEATADFDAAEASWESSQIGGATSTKFLESEQFKVWGEKYNWMSGRCVLHKNFADLEQIVNDPLHRLMDLVNWMMMRTCKTIAIKQESQGFSGIDMICIGAENAKMLWWSTKIRKRYTDACKDTVDHALATDDAVDLSEAVKAQEKSCKGFGRLVDNYVTGGTPIMSTARAKLELVDIGLNESQIPEGAGERRVLLKKLLLQRLRDGKLTKAELTFTDRLVKANHEEFEARVSKYADSLHVKGLSNKILKDVVDAQIDFMGTECQELLEGGALTMLESQNLIYFKLKKDQEAKQRVVQERMVGLRRTLKAAKAAKDVTQCAELQVEIQALKVDSTRLADELKNWKQLVPPNSDGSTDLYDDDVKKARDDWVLFTTWLLPICKGEMPTKEIHEARVSAWWEHHEASYGPTGSQYVHYCRFHMGDDLEWLHEKYPGLTLASLSAQRSEHCNKLVKLKMANLWAFTHGTGKRKYGAESKTSFELIMEDGARRLLHFLDTVPGECTDKCGACGEVGHRRTNTRKCTAHENFVLDEYNQH